MRTNERRQRMPNWAIGLVMVVVIAIGASIAYKKELPWNNPYEVSVTFASGQKLRPSNPVRIAGVTVGKVTEIELLDDEASDATASASGIGDTAMTETGGVKVTMALNEEALPLHEDALFKIRPRLFLEGNYFIEVQPGSPSAPTVEEGHTFPVNRTAYAVQLDQVLTTLQTDVRADLQTLLQEFGSALSVHGGADGLRALNRTGPLLQYSAQTAESFRGTQRGDLPGMISGLSKVLGGLARSEENLRNLVTNFEGFTGSFAAQNEALGRAIDQLPDTLAAADPLFVALNRSFPQVRAFAREALPGTKTTPASLRASRPFVEQLRLLMQPSELQGLVADLRPTVPKLYTLGKRNIELFTQNRSLSSCFNEVVVPWSKDEVSADPDSAIPYPHTADGEQVFEGTPYGFTGTAVESRSGDGNGQNLRVLGASGVNLVRSNIGGLGNVVSLTPFPILGAMPALNDSAKTPFKPNVPCETQEPPNLEGGVGSPPADQSVLPRSALGIQGMGSGPEVDDFLEMMSLTESLADSGSELRSSEDAQDDLLDAQEFWESLGIGVDLAAALGVELPDESKRGDRQTESEEDAEADPPEDSDAPEDDEE